MSDTKIPQGGYAARQPGHHPVALYPPYRTSVKRSPQAAPLSFPTSIGEESGPVFGHDLLGPLDADLLPLDPNFGGCGRTITREDGSYEFRTVLPGPYPWPNGPNDWRPAHIHFSLFGAGFAQRLITQMYFEGDPLIWRCPIVGSIGDKSAVERLIAPLDMARTVPMDARAYEFNIILRGRRQTMFENRMEGL